LQKKNTLFLNRACRVKGNKTSDIKRSLLEFSFCESEIKETHLIIETGRHQYTEDYMNLTKDFYLKM
jgi:tRNA1Val (adenine37-N6)-methyltransferase